MGVDVGGLTAVVLTHRRPRLATSLVNSLVTREGIPHDRIILVVDREGGLADEQLQQSLRVIRLTTNSGPAAGFRVGMAEAFRDPSTLYAYVCEDDVELTGLPMPRLQDLLLEMRGHQLRTGRPIGAVVAYGRRFRPRRGGTTLPYIPTRGGPRLQQVDVAAWGATIVSRQVHDAGIRPDDYWFFGYEDFDFFLKIAARGLDVLVDRDSADATAATAEIVQTHGAGNVSQRPTDREEPWRAFYVARNYFELARRHGDPTWSLWHLALSARRMWLAPDGATRRAIAAGLIQGLARRGGRNPRYTRTIGEWPVG